MKKSLFILTLLLISVCSVFAIDSQYLWAKSANSTNAVVPLRMKFDGSGNLYVLYSFSGSITISGSTRTSRGGKDFCLAKFDSNGALVWMRTGGTPGDDEVNAIEIDASGYIYVLGSFVAGTASFDNSNTGITTASASSAAITYGLSAAILIRYDQYGATGNNFCQVLRQSSGTGLSVTVSDMIITGSNLTFVGNLVTNTSSGSITYVVGANNGNGGLVSSANKRCYLASVALATFNRAACVTLYEMTKTQTQGVYGIAYDGSNYYVSGSFQGTIVTGTNLVGLPSPQTQDIFLAKLNSSLSKQWVKLIQGDGDELPTGLKVYSGGVYFASTFSSLNLNICTSGDGLLGTFKVKTKTSTSTDLLVLKYDLTSGNLAWDFNTPAGSVSTNFPQTCLDVNSEFVACSFVLNGSTAIEPDVLTSNGDDGAFCLLNPSNGTTKGAEIIQSTGSSEQSTVVAFNSEGKVHLGGVITSASKTLGDYQITSTSGVQNAYVAKFCPLVRLYGLQSTYSTASVGTVITLSGTPGNGTITSTTNTLNQSDITLQEGANTCTYTITKSGTCLNSYTKTATVTPCYTANDITIIHNPSYCMSASQVQLVAFVGSEQNPIGGGFTENGSFISKNGSVYTMDPASANEGMNAIEYTYSTAACPTIKKIDSANFIQGPSVNLNLGSTTGCAVAEFSVSASPMGSQYDVCNLTVTAGESAQEEFVFNNIALDQAYTFHPQYAEGYNLHIHMEYNGCTKDQYDNIGTYSYTVYPNPTVTFSGTSTICVNGSTQLTVEASGAASPYTYAWSGGGNSYIKSYNNLLSTTNAIITVTDNNGCQTIATQPITVNVPTVAITPSSAATCQNSSSTLTATSGFNSYSWSLGTSSTGTPGVVTVSPTVTSTYSVTASDAIGCTATASQQITVNSLPTVTITSTPSNGTVCAGSTVSLQSSAGNSYLWSNSATTRTITTGSAGSYNVTVTDANGCQNSATVGSTIIVNALPTVQVNADKAGVCSGGAVVLTANGASTYTWSSGATVRAQTYLADATPTVTVTGTVSYTVTGTDANGCTNTATTNLINVWKPSVTISPASPVACAGANTTLTATGSGTSGYSYLWNTTTAGSTLSAAAGSSNSVVVTDGNGCTASASKTVGTNTLPTVNIDGVTEACEGTSTSLTASGASSYIWSAGTPLTGTTTTVQPVGASYSVTATGTDANGCVNTATKTITVNPKPTVTISGTGTACNGGTVSMTAEGATTYVWQDNSTNATLSLNNATSPQYVRVIGSTGAGCKDTAELTTVIYALPTVSIVGGSQKYLYSGESGTTFTATGATTYSWSDGLGSAAQSASVSAAGNYTVTGTDGHGCTNTATATLSVLTACTWNGSAWVGGYIPDASKDAVISGKYKGASIDCKNLTVNDSLIVDSSKYVIVNGDFVNGSNGKVLIKSLPTGNTTNAALPIRKDGAMIFKGTVTNNGAFKVEQYYTAGATAHWVSIPVSQVTAGTFIEQGIIRPFTDGTNSTYGAKITDANQSLVPAKGYNFEKYVSGSFAISGSPNAGTYSYTLTKGTNGRSMMGNPYTSAIDLESSGWTYTNAKTAFAVWNPILKNYSTYNSSTHVGSNGGDRYIGSGQGFWVLVADNNSQTTPTIALTSSVQVANQYGKFKEELVQKDKHEIRIKINGSGIQDESVVLFYDGAINGNDMYDSYKFFNDELDMYMMSSTEFMSVNAIPLSETNLNENIYIKSNKKLECEVSIEGDETINGKNLVVENLKTGERLPISQAKMLRMEIDPKDSLYFKLKQYSELTSLENIQVLCDVQSKEGVIHFSAPQNTIIQVFDICGKKLTEQTHCQPFNAKNYLSSVLVISFITENGQICKKVFVQ